MLYPLSYERWTSGQSTAPQDPPCCPFAACTATIELLIRTLRKALTHPKGRALWTWSHRSAGPPRSVTSMQEVRHNRGRRSAAAARVDLAAFIASWELSLEA